MINEHEPCVGNKRVKLTVCRTNLFDGGVLEDISQTGKKDTYTRTTVLDGTV